MGVKVVYNNCSNNNSCSSGGIDLKLIFVVKCKGRDVVEKVTEAAIKAGIK